MSKKIKIIITVIAVAIGMAMAAFLWFYNNQKDDKEIVETPLPVVYSYYEDSKNGIMIGEGEAAMGTYACQIYITSDGGKSWTMQTDNSDGFFAVSYDAKFLFINLNDGFIYNPSRSQADSKLLITHDGGKTFIAADFVGDEMIEPFSGSESSFSMNVIYDYYNLPVYEDGILSVIVGQGSDGDWYGGKTFLRYQSFDKGNTWILTEVFRIFGD